MSVPFILPEPISVTVDLPIPPSVNALWKPRKGGGMYLSAEYQTWIKSCDQTLLTSREWRNKTIMGPCTVDIKVNINNGHGDLDNRIKALLDYAQRIELIDNDRLVMKLTAEWTAKQADAPLGCRLTLTELAG